MVKVAVVGAGVIGLATATELAHAGADVRCYDGAEPGSVQSKGLTRIFRYAHGDPRLVELAMRARHEWGKWEERYRRRLIGDEGLIVTGAEIAPQWERAMTEAGAQCRPLTQADLRDLLPIGSLPNCAAFFDPAGGTTRVRRIIRLLCEDIGPRLHRARVESLEHGRGGWLVKTAAGDWTCDEVVIAAGIDTAGLGAPLGLGMQTKLQLHSRFTFSIREEYRSRRLSCWIDDSGLAVGGAHAYCQRVGATDRYALGVSWEGQACSPDVGAEEVSRQSRAVAISYVQEVLSGLLPQPVDEIRCTYPLFPFLDGDDGFAALRGDGVTAFYGNNLFKFAPLLGTLLKETAISGVLSPDLNPRAVERAGRQG